MATTPDKPAPARPPKAAPKKKRRKAKAKGPKKPPHRPPHVPTPESRAVVQALAASGHTHLEIAGYLQGMMRINCGKSSLEKHYKTELGLSKMHQNLMVRQGLYRQAVGAPAEFSPAGEKLREEVKPNVTAQIFWSKCQAGWVEPQRHEHSGPEGQPIPVNISSLTTRQLEQLKSRLTGK